MSKSLNSLTSRRRFMAGASVAGAAIAAAASAGTAVTASVAEAAASATVVLHDPQFDLPPEVAARLAGNGAKLIALEGDPVRLWRSQVGQVLTHPQTRLFGVTRWADLLIVRGLAAETRRHLRHEQFHQSSGYFTWLID